MSLNIAFIIVYFIEMLIATIFFSSISQKKKTLPITLAFGTLIFEIGALMPIFGLNTAWLNVSFSVLATLIYSASFFKLNLKRAALYSVVLVAISSLLEHIVIFIMSSFSSLYLNNYQSDTTLLIIEIVLSKLIYFLFVMVLQRFSKKDSTILKAPLVFYIFPLTTLLSVVCLWYVSISQYMELKNQLILGVVTFLLFFATLFVFSLFQANAQRENDLFVLLQESNRIKTDLIYSEIIEKQNNSLRLYAHDARKHLLAIKELNTNPQIENYISEMMDSLDEYSHVSHSGNKILDVLINKCSTECNLNEVNFFYDVKNNNLSNVEYNDIVTIIGNLLDNAIEAATNSEEKYVSLETDFKNEYTVIIVSNSCDTTPKFDNSKFPVTTKKNKSMHGFGLKSVKKAVKKYGGDIGIEYIAERKAFTVTVMLDAKH